MQISCEEYVELKKYESMIKQLGLENGTIEVYGWQYNVLKQLFILQARSYNSNDVEKITLNLLRLENERLRQDIDKKIKALNELNQKKTLIDGLTYSQLYDILFKKSKGEL